MWDQLERVVDLTMGSDVEPSLMVSQLADTMHKLYLFCTYAERWSEKQQLIGSVGKREYTVSLNGGLFKFEGNDKELYLPTSQRTDSSRILQIVNYMFNIYPVYKYMVENILRSPYEFDGQVSCVYNGHRLEIFCYGDDTSGEYLTVKNTENGKSSRVDYTDSILLQYVQRLQNALTSVTQP